jgi:hypothetical protein
MPRQAPASCNFTQNSRVPAWFAKLERYFGCAALLALVLTAGCGGGSLGGNGATVVPGGNVASIFVDGGPAAAVSGINSAYVSVTICAPGTSNCQTVDHVLLDTGSTGLRLLASEVNASLALPQEKDAASDPLFECVLFADSYAWGSVRLADVGIADGHAASLPIQLIGDPAAPTAPSECSRAQTTAPLLPADTVASLNANGILGLRVFREDCGVGCNSPPNAGDIWQYYTCAPTCTGVTLDTPFQLQNPVYRFATNNNGVVIELPDVADAGAFGARGSLILGIDTQSNNALGTATVMRVDSVTGYFTTIYNGKTFPNSYIDSGSKGLYFDDTLTLCPAGSAADGLYCPNPAPAALSATLQSAAGISVTVPFSIGDALSLLTAQSTYNAFKDLGGPLGDPSAFDWGLPFFYGRKVYVAIEGQATSGGTGPFFAF